MSDEAHIVEIDRIVLTGVDPRNPGRLDARVAAEVQRALSGAVPRGSTDLGDRSASVAREVARTVVRSVQGGPDRA